MKIAAGLLVELNYEMKLEGGEVVESSAEEGPLVYLHGNDEIPARLEEMLEGGEVGTSFDLTLEPGDAFGEYDLEAMTTVPREQFPADEEIEEGMWIPVGVELEGEEGVGGEYEIDMRIAEIDAESVVLDANHPLAGQTVYYSVEVREVRKPTEEELAEHREHHCGESCDHEN